MLVSILCNAAPHLEAQLNNNNTYVPKLIKLTETSNIKNSLIKKGEALVYNEKKEQARQTL